MTDWEAVSLAEICGGKGDYGLVASAQAQGDHKFLRTTDMIGGVIDWATVPSSNAEQKKRLKSLLNNGDIVISRTGANAGAVGYVSSPPKGAVFAGYLVRFSVDKSRADSRFVYYSLCSPNWREHVESRRTGSAQPQLNAVRMGSYEFYLPPLDEQRRIAGVLGALDDLIDTNEQLITNLRENQRSAYCRLSAVPSQELTFGDVASLVRDRAAGDASTLYLGLEHFAENGAGIAAHGRLGDTVSQQLAFSSGDVLYGKLRPYFRKVDRPWFDGACSAEIWVLRPKPGVPSSFLHSVVDSPEFTEFAMSGSEGTRMPRAKWDHVVNYPVMLPVSDDLSRFESLGQRTWEALNDLNRENAELRRTRDQLLPLLMSGKIRVREAEQFVKELVA